MAFAVWQGKAGETLFDKSITSNFLTLYISSSAPTVPTSTITLSTTDEVTIVGLVVALVVLALFYVVFRK